MRVQLISTSLGCSAAAWDGDMLEGVTLPQVTDLDALATLSGYLKLDVEKLSERISGKLSVSQQQLEEKMARYFAGEVVTFDLPTNWARMTPFQQRVLKIVVAIPYGQSLSYGEVAKLAGCAGGARAVGGAVGANPWLLVVPCHRVLAKNHGLGGFGCGLTWKEKLLQIEKISYRLGHQG